MTRDLTGQVAKQLLSERYEALAAGKASRNIVSLLGMFLVPNRYYGSTCPMEVNVSEDPKTHLSDEELLAQMKTIMFAGHKTTVNTHSWTFLELTRHPEVQDQLRAEIRAKERNIFPRGDTEFSAQDLGSILYLTAVVNVGIFMILNSLFHRRYVDKFYKSESLITPLVQPSGTHPKDLHYRNQVRMRARLLHLYVTTASKQTGKIY